MRHGLTALFPFRFLWGTSLDDAATTPVVLSFDVEEHDRIEAAAGYRCPPEMTREYARRMDVSTRQLLERLADAGEIKATFYVVGQIAETNPKLVRDIAAAGHEIASHSYDHRRIHRLTPEAFREDLKRSVGTLEQAAGVPVVGYRAPTFSVTRETAWAVDVLAESGLKYDSSVFPVRHDRYGVPDAPRTPFLLEGAGGGRIVELPLVTYTRMGLNLPVAGGGYFRLFPLAFLRAGLAQMARLNAPGMLYFHPWEFDADQPKLPLGRLSRWRTYVGIAKSFTRLDKLLGQYRGRFRRAIDVVNELQTDTLPSYRLTTPM